MIKLTVYMYMYFIIVHCNSLYYHPQIDQYNDLNGTSSMPGEEEATLSLSSNNTATITIDQSTEGVELTMPSTNSTATSEEGEVKKEPTQPGPKEKGE